MWFRPSSFAFFYAPHSSLSLGVAVNDSSRVTITNTAFVSQVVAVAAAKHHTLVLTSAGEVWSFGNNRDGKLGYANPDTQPVPRK